MPDTSLAELEVTALRSLEQLAAERARLEIDTERAFAARKQGEESAYQKTAAELTATYQKESQTVQGRYQQVRKGILAQFETENQATEKEYDEARRKIVGRANTVRKNAKKENEDSRWQALAVFEGSKSDVVKRNKERELEIKVNDEQLQTLKADSEFPLADCRKFLDPALDAAPVEPLPPAEDPFAAFLEQIKQAEELLLPVRKLGLPRFLKWQTFVWPFLFLGAAAGVGLALVTNITVGAVVGVVLAIASAIGCRFWLVSAAKKQVGLAYPPFRKALIESEQLLQQCRDLSKTTFERQKVEIEERREGDTKKAEEKFERLNAEAEERRKSDAKLADEKYPPVLAEIAKRRDEAMKQAEDRYPKRLAELKEKYEQDAKQLQDNFKSQKDKTAKEYKEAWDNLIARWTNGLGEVNGIVASVNAEGDRLFLDWHNTDIDHWEPPTAVPPVLRFGEFQIDQSQIPDGVPRDPRLKSIGPTKFTLPAFLPFPNMGSLLLKASDATGRGEAAKLLQSVMIRYATSIPPGKVRFTIIDPVGLGENFAAFMHLADYSPLLVTNRIWTETPHIDQRLADLSEHMENVIQKYLRNEFQSIEEYNVHAGEVAEPFRILVVANFPVNFSETAAKRLLSIASSGARCGVYTLISVDQKQQMPSGTQLKDLEPLCLNLTWKEGKFHWRDPNFNRFPLLLDTPPEPVRYSKIMHDVGDKAKNANKVEVPFEFIAPKPEDYWTQDSRAGVDVPLGRAGATKLQSLKLGKGTSQHVLTAGKTGSGKSTLLHAMITNAALRYSPDQVELYLIDFKKGVEFKVYASMELPHAKVIAVESEREFGLSVLQRLDLELKTRGDRFRDLGVQDLRGYRDATNNVPPLPRILFIVDEFQGFFVEDDKIAQEVSLLLDRLVRQGRAFGIHVILGSQTLSGSFSLPRSTLGQMAVRIALQCSEADAHMILSEDNGAARLLTRPGEAIYNDANGMVEGNNFFQVVLLSDESRNGYLRRLRQKCIDMNRPPTDQIVFEGNLPAVPAKNFQLNQLLNAPAWGEPPKSDQAWLGDAIAIKDPTAAVFRPQSGNNLLMVGQTEAGALGMFNMIIISLAAQHRPEAPDHRGEGVGFYLLDGTPADAANAGILPKLAEVVPHPFRVVTWRELGATMTELAAEVERRQKGDPGEAANLYLFVYDLQRFRDLRKGDDDFGFSKYGEDKPVSPAKNFSAILRDGPPVGVHTIVWCDSLNNLNRAFDRQGLKEFEIRVLFQMSANDSSNLIDNPAAGKIGELRALYFSEEEGKLEKFRPYGLPGEDWLGFVRTQLKNRVSADNTGDGDGNGQSPSASPILPVEDGAAPAETSESANGNEPAPEPEQANGAEPTNGAEPSDGHEATDVTAPTEATG